MIHFMCEINLSSEICFYKKAFIVSKTYYGVCEFTPSSKIEIFYIQEPVIIS